MLLKAPLTKINKGVFIICGRRAATVKGGGGVVVKGFNPECDEKKAGGRYRKKVLADSLKTLKRVTTSVQRQVWNRLKSRHISNL